MVADDMVNGKAVTVIFVSIIDWQQRKGCNPDREIRIADPNRVRFNNIL